MEEQDVWDDQKEEIQCPENPLNLRGARKSVLTGREVVEGADYVGHLTLNKKSNWKPFCDNFNYMYKTFLYCTRWHEFYQFNPYHGLVKSELLIESHYFTFVWLQN